MGLRSSKHKRTSYDIAPVVSNKDFNYKKHNRPLPKVELPNTKVETSKENGQAVTATAAVLTPTADHANDVQSPRIPEWINETNFKKLLLKTHPDLKEIISFKANPAMAAGENYATLVLRIKISAKFDNGSTKDFSFIIKVPHDIKEMQEMMKTMNFFILENSVYAEVIPELEELYRDTGTIVNLGAKSYKLDLEDPNIHYVLLDDLCVDGFKNANRLECLDMDHALCVLRKMAQFHASSACRVARKGAYSPMFSPDMDNEFARNVVSKMFSSFKKPFMDNLGTLNDGEKYRELAAHFFDNIIEVFVRSRKILRGYFSVLSHGDSWSNNILFKYADNGKVEEAVFVDYQNCNWSSPASDLIYFIFSSVQIDIKLSKFEYFISYYHEHLIKQLKLLQYPLEIPNLRDFHIQINDFGSLATMTSFIILGVVLLESTENAKFENLFSDTNEGDDLRRAIYSNPRYRNYINEILPWLYNRGFMEINLTDLDNRIAAADKLEESSITAPTNNTAQQDENIEQSSSCYPEWVNESLFIDVVRADCENYHKIVKFAISPATNAGDNYSSILLRVDIDVELTDNNFRSLSYMLKISAEGEQSKALLARFSAFEKETTFYHEIISQFEKLYKEKAGTEVIFAPKSYKLSKDVGCENLVLENIGPKGFKNCDRLEGLDMEHTKAVLKKLAQFHAASAYLFETKGNFPEVFERPTYSEETREISKKLSETFYKLYLECVQQYKGNEEYIENLADYGKVSIDCLIKVNKIDWNKFNVLNHGDCWTNNIMFQHDGQGNIINTYFVDFQLIRYGTPASDLYYFLLSSPKLELKLDYFDYFVRYYHENLKAHLELLKYPKHIPSLKELHIELLNNGPWAMFTTMGTMAAVLLDPTEMASLEKLISSDEDGVSLKKQMFLNKRYRSHAEAIYPWLNRRGLLDFRHFLAEDAPDALAPPIVACNVPSWVDGEHFADILEECVENFDKILNISAIPATKSGDNYASSLLRVKIDYKLKNGATNTVSFILKVPLQSVEANAMISLWNFFDKEIAMYSKYLPEFENIYRQMGIEFNIWPKFYKFKKDVGKDVLLLEDLSQRGFKCSDRRKGLNLEHTKWVLRNIAKFHAVSAKYVEINGPFPQAFQTGIYTEETRAIFEQIDNSFMYKYFAEYQGFDGYKDKIPNLLKNFVDYSIRVSTVDPTEFNVLNHGDSWLNNLMFKHDSFGNIEEAYFIDFQVCKYGSPAQDLWYFIISSTELGLKTESFEYFIQYYHEHLVQNLELLKYSGQIPTLSELQAKVWKYGYTGFNTFTGVGAICLLEEGENANMLNYSAQTKEGEKFRKALFLNDTYKAHAAVVLPWLARRGCLD